MTDRDALVPLVKKGAAAPPRVLRDGEGTTAKPIYAVWELTLKCDQPCQHCGSRAGHARKTELSTAEVLDVARSLVELGCREVALIGGETYLRTDLAEIVRFMTDTGIRVGLQTGGRALTAERAAMLKAAGLHSLGVSIDGPARIHDKLRGNLGSHQAAMRALDAGREAGLLVTSNAQINRLNCDHLWEHVETLWQKGVVAWQVQLTVPMGRAADRPDWILEPYRVVDVIDTLAAIQVEGLRRHRGEGEPFNVFVGNNIGYYGPHETTLRSRPGGKETYWEGCRAGQQVIGLESDGSVKGCPSLPSAPYVGGNVRDTALRDIWHESKEVRFARDRTPEELWGFCKTCYYADVCRAGCSWTAHCTLGRRGNNPFCYHRVKTLEKRGVRETLVLKDRAPDEPYDFGRFEIVEEPLPPRGGG
jgi:radical SAM protein with 4Fe4S-binding SPASM domain